MWPRKWHRDVWHKKIETKLPLIINPEQAGVMTDRFLGIIIICFIYDVLSEANTAHKRNPTSDRLKSI